MRGTLQLSQDQLQRAGDRGHQLAWGAPYHSEIRSTQLGVCQYCHKWVQAVTRPDLADNPLLINGDAIHENCPKKEADPFLFVCVMEV